jgi:hypothetical protein
VSTAVGRGFGYLLIGGGILLDLEHRSRRRAVAGRDGLVLARRGDGRIAQRDGANALQGLTVADVIERDPICVLPP